MKIEVGGDTAFAATGGRPFDPDQPSILFIHGAGMDHTVWALQTRYFAYRNRNVLAVDLPGHGLSGGRPLTSIGAMADWVVALLDALKIEKAGLAGHSMGSLVALDAAARHGGRVDRLALLGTCVPMPVADPLLNAAKADDHAAIDMITLWGHASDSHIGGNRAPGLWITGEGMRLLERAKPGVLYADLNACNDYTTGLEAAAKVGCPVLLILGERDAMTPMRAAKALEDAFDGAMTSIIDGTGHMMMVERPDETLDALIRGFPGAGGQLG